MNLEIFKGKRVKVTNGKLAGQEFLIEDTWKNVAGESWQTCNGNPACVIYAIRSGLAGLPPDDNVLYGHEPGTLLHVSEIEIIGEVAHE